MNKTLMALVLTITIVALAAAGYMILTAQGTDASKNDVDTDTPTVNPNSNDDEPEEVAEEFDYIIEMTNHEYSLDEIEAKPGQTLKIKLINEGGSHDFVIDELNVQSKLMGTGQEDEFEISVPTSAKTGDTYSYYCSVTNHRQLGMEGLLKVIN